MTLSRSSEHIILVEDSLSQAVKMTHVLERAGWKVTCANTADAFFDALQESKPDLVLLDFYLPGVRGDEICRRLRRNIDTRNLPVVMLTSNDTSEAELRGLDSGADDFIAKGVDPEVLVLRLKNLLSKVHRQSEILASTDRPFRSARLMAIDDSPTFLEKLRPELESEGYEVETELNPRQALERLRDGTFDGVIVDLVMPDVDGIEVCRQVEGMRQEMASPLVTVVLTSQENRESHSRALLAGADDFVGKSSDMSVLKGRIRALLRRKFFEEENRRILIELRQKELQAVRERAEKEAAQARASLVEELQRTADELLRSQRKLELANQAKDQFLAILSHELRTPLTPVLATISLWQEDHSLSDQMKQDIAMVRRNVELEARLIDDLLDLTRITSGKLALRHAYVEMRPVIDHAVEICRPKDAQAAEITVECDFGDARVWGDSSRLTQVIWNLLRNAVKFTPRDGSITLRGFITAEDAQKHLVIEVIDTGIGIDPEILPTVFNAFEQGTREVTRQFGGLGLGLAISRAIAELHGGTLTATSEGRNRGATFRFEIPVMDASPPGTTPGNPTADAAPDSSPSPGRLRILVVEDHDDTAKALQRLLRRHSHDVTIATTVQMAKDLLNQAGPFDIMVSDWGLPDGTGGEILTDIPLEQRPLAIALTGFGMEDDVKASRKAGFSYHLTKPVDFAALQAAIASIRSLPKP